MLAKLHNIAVLIDADNASAKNIGYILQKVEAFGRITCKNIYGDWGNAHIKSWQEAMLKHAITPMQQFAYAKGKNATDIGMVIEAMDLLYSNNYDGFCLISSDSDFTALALRIRKNGIKVFGFGTHSTVNAFTQSCDEFYYVEDLLAAQKISSATEIKSQNIVKDINVITPITVKAWDTNKLKRDTKLLNSLRASIINHPNADAQCWLNLGLVGKSLKEHYPDFDPKNYGYDRLAGVLKNIDIFEIKLIETSLYIREKNYKKIANVPLSIIEKPPVRFTTQQLQSQTHLINILKKVIEEDPKSDKGWSNISYIASQIKQHHANINLDKYGYKKFSDLIDALNLYETRRKNSSVSIKLKYQDKPLESPVKNRESKINLQSNKSTKVSQINLKNSTLSKFIPNEHTTLTIYSSSQTDVRLFCMNSKQNNIGANDIIHIDKRHSKDNFILLMRKERNGVAKSTFMCHLDKQEENTDLLVFVVVSKLNNTFSKNCPNIEVTINNRLKKVLFFEEFNVQNKTGKNLLLLTLKRIDSKWNFLPQNTIISNDLREICNITDTLE
ncbi:MULTISPECIES: NYN domain-containing protein [unclassified Psychrobacter]|uniref:NYN domain-containing protein n=1 Tax=unclassified Psychrobacter TaxID=196806 RepID=UPI0025B5256D|nr:MULTISPECIES: NYN domain-containing protein [unclassified Psychrobacter]MDN3453726.1 NYN domain-containing protein [Psychrobacter sp. APC 3350]MDN3502197.1 NYN domain-containing protein [Psychrobacter sp. 5A.1]